MCPYHQAYPAYHPHHLPGGKADSDSCQILHRWRGERLCRHCQVPDHLIFRYPLLLFFPFFFFSSFSSFFWRRLYRHCPVPDHLIFRHLGEWCQELRYSWKWEKEKNSSRQHLIFRHFGLSCQNLLGDLGEKIKHYVSPINWFVAKSPSPSADALNTKKLLNHMLHTNY